MGVPGDGGGGGRRQRLGPGQRGLQALDGVGYEIWTAAKLDAAAWNVTWLPALTSTTVERAAMSRGVAAPQIRKNLDLCVAQCASPPA